MLFQRETKSPGAALSQDSRLSERSCPIEYRFSELVDLSGFQQVMQSWYSVAGVATALLDTDRNSLCAVGWQDICTRFHHLSPKAGGRCNQSDDAILSHLRDGSYVMHKCSKGLMNCAMPVVVKGEHMATLFMGQFLHEPPDEAFFRQQAQELGVDAAAYLAALGQVPIISEERLLAVITAQTVWLPVSSLPATRTACTRRRSPLPRC